MPGWYAYFMAGLTVGVCGVIAFAVLLRPRGWYEAAAHKCGLTAEFDSRIGIADLNSKPCPDCGEYQGWKRVVIRKRIFRAIEIKS